MESFSTPLTCYIQHSANMNRQQDYTNDKNIWSIKGDSIDSIEDKIENDRFMIEIIRR